MPDDLQPWETPRGAAVTTGVTAALATGASIAALVDATGSRWMGAGLSLIAFGLALANLSDALATHARRQRDAAHRPTRPYNWGTEPDETVVSLTARRPSRRRGWNDDSPRSAP